MPVSHELILGSARLLARIPGLSMSPHALVEDTALLGVSFPDENEFRYTVAATHRAIHLLVAHSVTPTPLKDSLANWYSYHYQHKTVRGNPADCRIIFRYTDAGIEVKSFGHR